LVIEAVFVAFVRLAPAAVMALALAEMGFIYKVRRPG